jgi:alkylhydroperoxidase family enzyme
MPTAKTALTEVTPMPSTFRIPKADLGGVRGRLYQAYCRRRFGRVLDGLYVYFHHPKLMNTILRFEGKVATWNALDPNLKSYAEMASAAMIGCSWCMDYGYFMAHNEGLDEAKVREVPRWRESDVFDELELRVLEYTEAMTATPPQVSDEMVATLVEELGPKAVVELTQVIALENMRSRFNSAAGLASQGFSDVCELPLATAGARDRMGS